MRYRLLNYFLASVCRAVCILLAGFAPGAAAADWKPSRNVELVVGSTAGGGNDTLVRVVQKILTERRLVEVPVTVVNKAGGGGSIAFVYLNQHAGDAHYIALAPFNLITNHLTGLSTLHHGDVTAIAQIISEYTTIMVRADSPFRTGVEFLNRLKADPASLSISVGTARGNGPHIALGLAARAAGVDARRLRTVVFQSGGESNLAVMGGHVDAVTSSASNVVSAAGRMRALAVSAPDRLGGALAQIPTWREQGIDVVLDNWRGIVGPKGLAAAQVAYWEGVFARLAETEEWKRELERYQWGSSLKGGRELRAYLDVEYQRLRSPLAELGMVK